MSAHNKSLTSYQVDTLLAVFGEVGNYSEIGYDMTVEQAVKDLPADAYDPDVAAVAVAFKDWTYGDLVNEAVEAVDRKVKATEELVQSFDEIRMPVKDDEVEAILDAEYVR